MHETSPPPNPFESPQAVDPPSAAVKWRPRRRDLLIGVAAAPLASLAIPAISAVLVHSQKQLEDNDAIIPLLVAGMALVFSYAIAIPGGVVAFYFRDRLTIKNISLAWLLVISLTALGTACVASSMAEIVSFTGLFAATTFLPFAAFALYLAHLRRRDLRRASN